MREAAGDLALAAGRFADRVLGRLLDRVVEFFEAIPGDRRLERVVDHAAQDQLLHRVGHADEGVAPHAGRAGEMRLRAARLRHAAMIRAALARALHPRADIVIGRLERQHHDGDRAVRGARVVGLGRIENAAVRRIEPGLRDGAHRARGGEEVLEAHRAAVAKRRAILQPHPGLRDDAENAFRADHHAIGARARAGAGQAAPLKRAARRHRAQRFHEVVDVGVERREMPAAARRDPAAERRILEALREMAERQAMRLELRFERGAIGAALDQRGARRLVDLLHLAHLAQVDRHSAFVILRSGSTPPHTLDPPPNGVTVASAPPAQSSTAATSLSLRG